MARQTLTPDEHAQRRAKQEAQAAESLSMAAKCVDLEDTHRALELAERACDLLRFATEPGRYREPGEMLSDEEYKRGLKIGKLLASFGLSDPEIGEFMHRVSHIKLVPPTDEPLETLTLVMK